MQDIYIIFAPSEMQRRDYYEILQVFPGSTAEEIKRSFRKLALRFHPDRNHGSEQYSRQFKELAAAYEILSDPSARKEYDRENGFNTPEARKEITPAGILHDAARLRNYVYNTSLFSVDQQALIQQYQRILSERNISLLREFDQSSINRRVVSDMMDSTRYLPYRSLNQVLPSLLQLAEGDQQTLRSIEQYVDQRKSGYLWDRFLPYLVLLITLFLCVLMYFL